MVQARQSKSEKQALYPEWMERGVLALRWFALVVIFDLTFFETLPRALVPPLYLIPVLAAYNLLVTWQRNRLRSRPRVLLMIALEGVIATLAVYLTGGVHSSYFVLYIVVMLSSAFYLNLVQTILVTLFIGILYFLICFVNSPEIFNPASSGTFGIQLSVLLLVGLVSDFVVEELRRQHAETEREAMLAARLDTLNNLLAQLTASLELNQVLQTIVHASRQLLGADIAAISLLDENGQEAYTAASEGLRTSLGDERRWSTDEEPFRTILRGEKAYVRGEAGEPPPRLMRIIEREGIKAQIDVPLTLDQVPIGLLSVAERTPRAYTEQERALLVPLAYEAAIAVRNARLYEREKQQVEQLRTLQRLQDNFVSYVSHELRTPLTAIKTSAALLKEIRNDGSNAAKQELVETIAHNTGRLEAMVSDLLQMTQLEAGQLKLTRQLTDVRVIARRAIQSIHPLFDDKEQTIEFHAPEKMEQVQADRRRLEQVLVNLLSNAHKYSPRGARTTVQIADKPDVVSFSVSDNGPGMSLSQQEHVFEKFYVGANANNGTGVGLGLYITRGLVELFGGRIWVESEPGRGSTFAFTLPKQELTDEDIDR